MNLVSSELILANAQEAIAMFGTNPVNQQC